MDLGLQDTRLAILPSEILSIIEQSVLQPIILLQRHFRRILAYITIDDLPYGRVGPYNRVGRRVRRYNSKRNLVIVRRSEETRSWLAYLWATGLR